MKNLMDSLNRFGETTTGKVVIVALTLVVLLAAVFIVYRFVLSPSGPEGEPQVITQQQTPSEPQAASDESTSPAKAVEKEIAKTDAFDRGFEIFSSDILRDPFAEKQAEVTETSEVQQEEENALSLAGVEFEEGTGFIADVIYNNQLVQLEPGQSVGSYMLVSIGEDQARFLYGDVPFTLKVGQTYYP